MKTTVKTYIELRNTRLMHHAPTTTSCVMHKDVVSHFSDNIPFIGAADHAQLQLLAGRENPVNRAHGLEATCTPYVVVRSSKEWLR